MGLFEAIKETFGFSTSSTNALDKLPPVAGPFLRFETIDLTEGKWKGSILVLTRKGHGSKPPAVVYAENLDDNRLNIGSTIMFRLEDAGIDEYKAWRADLTFQQNRGCEKSVQYCVLYNRPPQSQHALRSILASSDTFTFYIPQQDQPFHWYFYSCNGISAGQPPDPPKNNPVLKGIQPGWWDVFQTMRGCGDNPSKRYHLGVGIGDQIYMDGIFDQYWVKREIAKIQNRQYVEKLHGMVVKEIDDYYMHSYVKHFTSNVYGRLLGAVPQVMLWDDHEIFDGYGSYADRIMSSPLVQTLFDTAKKYYLLFQHHTTQTRIQILKDCPDIFGRNSFNLLKHLDPQTALLGVDTRSEREYGQCIAKDTYEAIFKRLNTDVAETVRHLVIALPIPIVWPSIFVAEAVLTASGFLTERLHCASVFSKNTIYQAFMNPFNEAPELLDDLVDQWSSRHHVQERKQFIERLQEYAQARHIRITFISGDVHCCGVGLLKSKSLPSHPLLSAQGDNTIFDHRLMFNVVSSAIVNSPPPDEVLKLLHLSAILISNFTNHLTRNLEENPVDLCEEFYRQLNVDIEKKDYERMCQALVSHRGSPYLRKFLIPAVTSYLRNIPETREEWMVLNGGGGLFENKIIGRRNWAEVQTEMVEGMPCLHFTLHVSPVRKSIVYHDIKHALQTHQMFEKIDINCPPLCPLPEEPSVSYLDDDDDDESHMAPIDVHLPLGCLPLSPWMGISWYAKSREGR